VRFAATAPTFGPAADAAAVALKVEVVGTEVVATVGAAGQFTLPDVPSGQVQLHFTGTGVDAYVTVGQVNAGETVTITVTVAGSTAALETLVRDSAGEQELEGRIESLPPTQPAGMLIVSGRTVIPDASTVIKQGGTTRTFADLAVGQRVHVKGQADGAALAARIIEIQNVQDDVPVEIN
jgi:hypothetical protein